ncbi:hypothetical protein B0H66DRAFT_127965 [Apodospora peruviana]|uniref:Uncharacterized protein n=1 Tax=Apodospora peruviana TaxID=516989 RepID=A0AAE0IJI9_9PEZI|nr:hypothetical protein B0H66DRAFT_127965 [Apodospora peruviana]
MEPFYHALIRTHHITSRKKVASLRKAAGKHGCYALLRSGGCPGIMYCKGSQEAVREWVSAVQRLRYKDFHLASKPAEIQPDEFINQKVAKAEDQHGLFEVETVSEFAHAMEQRGISAWWRRAMEFA